MNKLVWHGDKIMQRVEKQAPRITSCLAKIVAETARRLVPVKTGALQATIRAEGGTVSAGGGEVDYAGVVELGTAKRAAKPYMRPAVEQLSKDAVDKCIK